MIGASFPMTVGSGGAGFGANGVPLIIETTLTGTSPIRVRGGGDGYEVRFAHPGNTFISDIQLGDATYGSAVLGYVADGSIGDPGNVVTLGYRFFDGEATQTGTGTLRAFADVTLPPGRTIRIAGGDHWDNRGGVLDTNGFNVTVAGAIAELDSQTPLKKTGAGTLRLDGANTYTGETTVAQGALGGVGAIAAVRVEPGASLSPGPSAGTLRTGDVTWEAGAGLELDFDSAASADRLEVAGQVTLNGDVPLSLRLNYAPAAEQTFVVIANDGSDPVQTGGLFMIGNNTLEEGESFAAAGVRWTISYIGGDGNDVALTFTVTLIPPDFDQDGDVDSSNLAAFEGCASGPAIPHTGDCGKADFDGDNDVDQVDFGIFQRCWSGGNKPADPNCAN
ncbi:MAG TPA: autotransporter-associated beta strand repeat-containing protein [Phycisphaerae bacterium]|nr:autotransporter-associated beta strand repeat-containing protein [Phycisphaerae bacterium]HRY68867.1 autotransporter-associated beta strand repeat-containing protein [Phycisphaerae bacterium]